MPDATPRWTRGKTPGTTPTLAPDLRRRNHSSVLPALQSFRVLMLAKMNGGGHARAVLKPTPLCMLRVLHSGVQRAPVRMLRIKLHASHPLLLPSMSQRGVGVPLSHDGRHREYLASLFEKEMPSYIGRYMDYNLSVNEYSQPIRAVEKETEGRKVKTT